MQLPKLRRWCCTVCVDMKLSSTAQSTITLNEPCLDCRWRTQIVGFKTSHMVWFGHILVKTSQELKSTGRFGHSSAWKNRYQIEGYSNCSQNVKICQVLLRSVPATTHTDNFITVWKDSNFENISQKSANTIRQRPVGQLLCLLTTGIIALTRT